MMADEEGFEGMDRRQHGRYSGVITLGNMLNIVALLGACLSLYVTLNARLSVVEANQVSAQQAAEHRDAETNAMKRDWADSVHDLRNEIARTNDKIDRLLEMQSRSIK